MKKERDLMDWLANTKGGNAVAIAAGVVFAVVIVIIAYAAS